MTQLEKSVFGAGFVSMTEEELYEVNGGRWFGRDKSDKPKKEKTVKEKHTRIHIEAHMGRDIGISADYENSSKTSSEKKNGKKSSNSIELNRIDSNYVKKYGFCF